MVDIASVYIVHKGDIHRYCTISEDESTPKVSPRMITNYDKNKCKKSSGGYDTNNEGITSEEFTEEAKTPLVSQLYKSKYSVQSIETVKYLCKESINIDLKNFIDETIEKPRKNITIEKTEDYLFSIPNVRALIDSTKTDISEIDKSKTWSLNCQLNSKYPKNYLKNLHELRMKNAELRKQFSECSRDKERVKSIWTERSKYIQQTKKLFNGRKSFIAKYNNEFNKQIKEKDNVTTNINSKIYLYIDVNNTYKELSLKLTKVNNAISWCEGLFLELMGNENSKNICKPIFNSYGIKGM